VTVGFDSQLQRKIMGQFATGVTVITMTNGDETWGMTANAVTSVSLDPPLVLVCVERKNQTHPRLSEAGCFAINILAAGQKELSDRFAFPGPKDCSGLDVTTAVTGAPILPGTLGHVDCQVHQVVAAGDHDIFLGEIVGGELSGGEPLVFFSGGYRELAVGDISGD
jgi:flavin reductase (DIM6/NTAB) family NADH-FMN oxidoreductase RutF